MKFGKFVQKAKDAKDKLKPGEVKTYDPETKTYISNKDKKARYNEITGKRKN